MISDTFFDPLDPGVLKDPYPSYRRLRENDPVHWHPRLNSWLLTRYAECFQVLGDSECFAADFRRVGIPTPPTLLSLQTLDPPDQASLRQFATAALQAQDFEALQADAERRAEKLVEKLGERRTFDFVIDFADPFTLGTICALLGVDPPAQDEHWDLLNSDLDRSMDSDLVDGAQEPGLKARAEFNALVDSWLANNPEKGILGYIARNKASVDVSHEILLSSVRAFWHAGFEVPSRFLGNAILTLLNNPGAIAALRKTRSVDRAVEELVRYVGPVHALSRACTRDIDLGDKKIRAGDIVVALIGAGNRDPAQFPNPEELILNRSPNAHLGFGRGAHSCMGAHVARMECRVVISAILRSWPKIRLAGEASARPNATLRGQATLPVTVSADVAELVTVA